MTLPTAIGPYQVTEILGRGAMGVICAGRHRQDGRAVAIKAVTARDAGRLGHLRREIRALARLNHPGVIRIFDHGVTEAGPWYAMERLEGRSLNDLMAECRVGVIGTPASFSDETLLLPEDAGHDHGAGPDVAGACAGYSSDRLAGLLAIVRRVAEVLAYVHGEGIVHRDIKASNIFIRANGLPVLVDFGLAEEMGGAVGRENIDPVQRIGGSPAYMSPEQIRGETLDARSDLYSLGCLLYEIVVGRPPFTGEPRAILQGHLTVVPAPPSTLVEGVPAILDRLIVELLEKDRDRRRGYAETVASTLASLDLPAVPWSAPFPTAKPYLYRSAFVGRRDLLAVMASALNQCASAPGTMIALGGESGAGKTRLALESAILARRAGYEVVSGGCLPRMIDLGEGDGAPQSPPLFALRPLIDTVVDRCVEGGEAAKQRLVGRYGDVLAEYFPGLKDALGVTESPLPLPSATARQRLFDALSGVLVAFAESRPLLLVFDDLQWADDLTMGFLAHFKDGPLQLAKILVLATFRSEERTAALDALCDGPGGTRYELRRMNAGEVSDMAGGMLAMSDPPLRFTEFLAGRSNGNPFFIAEYLRVAVAHGVLVRDSLGRWSLGRDRALDAETFDALPLPQSLHQLIELRLSKLGVPARGLLDIAALVGRTLELPLLQQVAGIGEGEAGDIVDELVRRQIIEPTDSDEYHFIHDKIREIAQSHLPEESRAGIHLRIAAAMEEIGAATALSSDRRAAIGQHWAAAGEPERAVPHLHAAAAQAQQVHATADAVSLFTAALRELRRISQPTEAWRREALAINEALGDGLALLARHAEAREVFADAAQGGADAVTNARLHRKAGKTWEIEHEHEKALNAYADAERVLQAGGGGDVIGKFHEQIQIALNKTWVFYWTNHLAEIEPELERVRPLVESHGRPGHRYHYFLSLVNKGNRSNRFRVDPQTLDYARNMVVAAEEAGNAADLAFAHFGLGFTLLLADVLDAAEAELFRAVERCRLIGDASGETRAMNYLVILHRRRGRIEETLELAGNLLTVAAKRKMGDYLGGAHAALGWCAWRRGDRAEALRHNRQALATWAGLSFPYPFQWTAVLTEFALYEGSSIDRQTTELVRMISSSPQCRLPDPIERELLTLADDLAAAGDGAVPAARLQGVVTAATALGYL